MRIKDLFGEGKSSVHAQYVSDFLETLEKLRVGRGSGLDIFGRGVRSIVGCGKVSALGE